MPEEQGDAEAPVQLYRPVGPKELELIAESGWQRFPDRLPEQPIFYPFLTFEYAEQIARRWNVRDSGYGAVTAFKVRGDFIDRYEVHQVGGSAHQEYWIPAGDLNELNRNLVGPIVVMAEYGRDQPGQGSGPS